jgi:hypothetical protein
MRVEERGLQLAGGGEGQCDNAVVQEQVLAVTVGKRGFAVYTIPRGEVNGAVQIPLIRRDVTFAGLV